MRGYALLAVLAIAMPIAAFADSNVGFTNRGGTLSGTSAGLSVNTSTIAITGLSGEGRLVRTNAFGFSTGKPVMQFAIPASETFLDSATSISSGDSNIVVPEPGTLGLLGTGLVGIAGLLRRKLSA